MSANIRGPPSRMGPAPIKGKIIIDTGSGVHIVGKNNIPKQSHPWIQRAQPVCLNTANGQINADQSVLIGSQRFRGTIRACVLDNRPNVLSVGQLCNNGWTFHWEGSASSAPSLPVLISPDGRQFHLSVRNNVPYLDSNDQLNLYRDKSVGLPILLTLYRCYPLVMSPMLRMNKVLSLIRKLMKMFLLIQFPCNVLPLTPTLLLRILLPLISVIFVRRLCLLRTCLLIYLRIRIAQAVFAPK